jgi:hypothetical protein
MSSCCWLISGEFSIVGSCHGLLRGKRLQPFVRSTPTDAALLISNCAGQGSRLGRHAGQFELVPTARQHTTYRPFRSACYCLKATFPSSCRPWLSIDLICCITVTAERSLGASHNDRCRGILPRSSSLDRDESSSGSRAPEPLKPYRDSPRHGVSSVHRDRSSPYRCLRRQRAAALRLIQAIVLFRPQALGELATSSPPPCLARTEATRAGACMRLVSSSCTLHSVALR